MKELAAQLRHSVELWKRSPERTDTGHSSESWLFVARFQAGIEPIGVGMLFEGMTPSALPQFRVIMRARPDIAIEQRLHWGETRLSIRQLIRDAIRPGCFVLRCEELRQ